MASIHDDPSILDQILQIQNRTNALMQEFKSLPPDDIEGGNALIRKINELSQMRKTLFDQLATNVLKADYNLEKDKEKLNEKHQLVIIMEDKLNKTARDMNRIRKHNQAKVRMVQINEYYALKYAAQLRVVRLIILVLAVVALIIVFGRMGIWTALGLGTTMGTTVATGLITFILVVGGVYIWLQIRDILARDDIDFNQYRWDWTPPKNKHVPVAPDDDEPGSWATGFCIDGACCAEGTVYDKKRHQCVVAYNTPTAN